MTLNHEYLLICWYSSCFSDINECDDHEGNNCHQNATCTDTIGSYTCTCMLGYSGNGTICDGVYDISSQVHIKVFSTVLIYHIC